MQVVWWVCSLCCGLEKVICNFLNMQSTRVIRVTSGSLTRTRFNHAGFWTDSGFDLVIGSTRRRRRRRWLSAHRSTGCGILKRFESSIRWSDRQNKHVRWSNNSNQRVERRIEWMVFWYLAPSFDCWPLGGYCFRSRCLGMLLKNVTSTGISISVGSKSKTTFYASIARHRAGTYFVTLSASRH